MTGLTEQASSSWPSSLQQHSTHPLGQGWIVVFWVKQVLVLLELFAKLGCVRGVFQAAVCCCTREQESRQDISHYHPRHRSEVVVEYLKPGAVCTGLSQRTGVRRVWVSVVIT